MSGTIFFSCLTSAISALSGALRISASPAAPKRWRKGCKNRKETTEAWKSQRRRRWTWPSLSRQVLQLWTVRLRRKARGILKASCPQIGCSGKPDARRRKSNPDAASSSQGWQEICSSGSRCRETCRDRRIQWNLSLQDIQDIQELQETQETRKPKATTKIGHTFSMYQQITCCTWKRFSRSSDKDMVAVRRIKWKT